MRRQVNYRLSDKTINTIEGIAVSEKSSNTTIVEKAVEYYSLYKKTPRNPFVKYSGILTEQEADELNEAIISSRKSKKIVEL